LLARAQEGGQALGHFRLELGALLLAVGAVPCNACCHGRSGSFHPICKLQQRAHGRAPAPFRLTKLRSNTANPGRPPNSAKKEWGKRLQHPEKAVSAPQWQRLRASSASSSIARRAAKA